jgi:hypothetical protein
LTPRPVLSIAHGQYPAPPACPNSKRAAHPAVTGTAMDSETFWIETAAWLLFACILAALIVNKYDISWSSLIRRKGYEKL